MFDNLTSRATFYDVTGYLIPGMLSSGIGWATICLYAGTNVWDSIANAIGKMGGVVTALALIAVGYVNGHLLNALSSAIYEKWLLKNLFSKAKDWKKRLPLNGKSREARIRLRAKLIYGVEVQDLQSIDLRIRAEVKMPQSFVTGFCFLSFYGMCRTLSFIAVLTLPLMVKMGWDNCCYEGRCAWYCKLLSSSLYAIMMLGVATAFAYQYFRFAKKYYDYLGSTLLFVADGEELLSGDGTTQSA